MTEVLSIIAISVIFLSGIIPLVMDIVHYARENRRLDREEKEKTAQVGRR